MDPFNRKSAELSREPVGLRQSEDSDDQDSYELAAATVSDGFRPADLTPTDTSSSSTPNNPEIASPDSSQARLLALNPSGQSQPSSAASKPPPPTHGRPSSAIKPPRPHDSLTLQNDGSTSTQTGASLPSSTGMPQLQAQSPYQGPTSASHPYQMYLQRTLSDTTTSTNQPANSRSYDGPRGPAHPYALYPQNIATTGDETPHQIPVGFSTSGDGYQRQLGPEGEEAGALVGPLGHTEELPPYTRYPDQFFASKPRVVAAPGDGMAETSTPAAAITRAGGIGVAMRNPEFSSIEEDLRPSQSRPSTLSRHNINTAAQGSAEKARMNKWQRRGKKKLWGIVPYWAICLLFVGVILLGVILGAVIGTVLSHHKSQSSDPPSDNYPTPTPTSDVIPIYSVPPSLPRLPVGNYSLPPIISSSSPNACLTDRSQQDAWSCNLPYAYYQLNIAASLKAKDTSCYNLTLRAINSVDVQFLWGTQPPNIFNETMTLVNDIMEPRRGPAWWYEVTYDKIVIVQEQDFSAKAKRWDNMVDHDMIRSTAASTGAKNGDKPWICTWPDTKLEVFIYPIQNASSTNPPSSTVSSAPNPYPTDGFHFYPKTVKLVESRVAQTAPKAYCRQVEIVNDGRSYKNLNDTFGIPIVVDLDEDPNDQKSYRQKREGRPVRRSWNDPWVTRQAYDLTPCGCLWWSSSTSTPV